jgi:hypothetical protein
VVRTAVIQAMKLLHVDERQECESCVAAVSDDAEGRNGPEAAVDLRSSSGRFAPA